MRTEGLQHRLLRVLPGGNTRTATHFAPFPVIIERGHGYRVWDVDGNEYIDFLNNYTSLVHGHAFPPIVEAIRAQLERGTVFPAPGELQAELGERIVGRFPAIERLRFTNSGTEAVMMATRAARSFTGRDVIVKAIGGYHGSWEQVSVDSAEGDEAHDAAAIAGIPPAVRDLVAGVRFNDLDQLREVVARNADRLAAILLEPVLGHVIEPATVEFLLEAQTLAERSGALFILDEVVTARLHNGGLQVELALRPDLSTLGKIIGGGLPVGAFGGRADVLDRFDPRRDTHIDHHGTFNGNPLTMAAGCASLDALPQDEIDRINALGGVLARRLQKAIAETGIDAWINHVGSLLNVRAEARVLHAVHRGALAQGLYIAPRGAMNISTCMDDDVVGFAGEAMSRVFENVAREVDQEDGGIA